MVVNVVAVPEIVEVSICVDKREIADESEETEERVEVVVEVEEGLDIKFVFEVLVVEPCEVDVPVPCGVCTGVEVGEFEEVRGDFTTGSKLEISPTSRSSKPPQPSSVISISDRWIQISSGSTRPILRRSPTAGHAM